MIASRSAVIKSRGGVIGKIVLFILAILCVSGGSYFYFQQTSETAEEIEVRFYQVTSAPFVHDVVESGDVESAENVEVKSLARGYRSTTSFEVLWVIPEGEEVKEGDLLVRLDSSSLEEEYVRQQMDVTQSIASQAKAENELAAAQIAMKEYIDGIYLQDRQQAQAAITLAKENLRRAEEYLLYSSRLAAKGYVTSLQLEGDRFAVEKAKIELEKAQKELEVLEEYTKEKKIKALDSDIKVAEANLEAAKERRLLEDQMLAFFSEQIENCEIRAPLAGQVVHANVKSSRSNSEFVLEEGAAVRERQTLVRLPDYDSMQIECKINESRISLIEVGMPATIKLDAFDGVELQGEVVKVNEYPEPISYYSSPIKKYATIVKVNTSTRQIKPGLSAQVSIHVEASDREIQVPVQSVYQHGTEYYCMVRNGNNDVEARQVEVGSNNSKFVVIKNGLQENEMVAKNPRKFLGDVNLPEIDSEKEALTKLQNGLERFKRLKTEGYRKSKTAKQHDKTKMENSTKDNSLSSNSVENPSLDKPEKLSRPNKTDLADFKPKAKRNALQKEKLESSPQPVGGGQ